MFYHPIHQLLSGRSLHYEPCQMVHGAGIAFCKKGTRVVIVCCWRMPEFAIIFCNFLCIWVLLTLAVTVVIIHCLKLSVLNTHNSSIHTCISISIICASQASNSWPLLITAYRSTLNRGPRPPPPLIGIPLPPLPLQTQNTKVHTDVSGHQQIMQ